jgi:hypothetical protein
VLWGVLVLVSIGLTGALLNSGTTADATLTNHPESYAARDLTEARLPGQQPVDEIIVVRRRATRPARSSTAWHPPPA